MPLSGSSRPLGERRRDGGDPHTPRMSGYFESASGIASRTQRSHQRGARSHHFLIQSHPAVPAVICTVGSDHHVHGVIKPANAFPCRYRPRSAARSSVSFLPAHASVAITRGLTVIVMQLASCSFPSLRFCLDWLATNLEKGHRSAWNVVVKNSDNQPASVPGKRV